MSDAPLCESQMSPSMAGNPGGLGRLVRL